MNYKQIYWDLIKKAIKRQYSNEPLLYYEVHHIIPIEQGGKNKGWNKVKLTIREHIIAHFLIGHFMKTGYSHNQSARKLARIRMKNICTGIDKNGHKINYYLISKHKINNFKKYDELKLVLEWFINQNILAGQKQKGNLNISKVYMKNMLVYFSKNFEISYEEE